MCATHPSSPINIKISYNISHARTFPAENHGGGKKRTRSEIFAGLHFDFEEMRNMCGAKE